MAVRTVHRDGSVLFVAHGVPDARQSLALGEGGIILHLGDEESVLRWVDLEAVEFRLSGLARVHVPWPVRYAARILRGLYAVLAAVAFVITFGGLGGAPPGSEGAIWITPFLRGRPRAFAVGYSVPIRWPRNATELEQRWFGVVIDNLAGTPHRIDVVGLAELLDSAAGVCEFESRISEFVR